MSSCQERIYGSEFTQAEIAEAVRDGRLLSMEIEFNQSCNFRCIYCYASQNDVRREELSREEFIDVIQQAKDLGARKIIILGGEPMLYPHIIDMIRHIRGLEMEVELFTNGANITLEIAQTLVENRVRVVLKMNSFDESLQDTLSGQKGAHSQIQEAFNNLKLAASEQAPRICSAVLEVIGIMAYKNDSPYGVGRQLRDALSARLMVANERIHAVDAGLLLIAKEV